MLKNLKVFTKIGLSVAIIFVLIFFVLFGLAEFVLKKSFLRESTDSVVKVVEKHSNELELQHFYPEDKSDVQDIFGDFFEKLQDLEVFSLRVINREREVLFAESLKDEGLSEKVFANKCFDKAIEGEVVTSFKKEKCPATFEHDHFFKVFIPFFVGDDSDPAGVFEIDHEIYRIEFMYFLRNASLLLATASLLICFILLFVVFRFYIRTPLKQLEEIAADISKGRFDKRFSFKSIDEISKRGNAFNIMASKLKESKASLDRKIRIKTSELQKFKLAVEGSFDLILIIDNNERIIYANPISKKFTGYAPEELVGRHPSFFRKNLSEDVLEKMWHILRIKKSGFKTELTSVRKDGSEYVSELHVSPILSKKGKPKFFVSIERDVTKEKALEKAQSEFLTLASHQLRTPISAMKWTLELLLKQKNLTEKQRNIMSSLYDSNERLINLVKNFLNVTKIELDEVVVDKRKTDLCKLMTSLCYSLNPLADKLNKTIECLHPSAPVKAKIDPFLFSEAFENILSNALNYSPEGSVVTVKASLSEKFCTVSIHNFGPFISKNMRGKIFDKFALREGSNISKFADGTGLGLFIAKWAIEKNEGKIWIKSDKKLGNTFYFTVPIL